MLATVFIYLGIAIAVAVGIWGIRRATRRDSYKPAVSTDDYLDQTCELNYKPDEN
jgi:hypothetical protein